MSGSGVCGRNFRWIRVAHAPWSNARSPRHVDKILGRNLWKAVVVIILVMVVVVVVVMAVVLEKWSADEANWGTTWFFNRGNITLSLFWVEMWWLV